MASYQLPERECVMRKRYISGLIIFVAAVTYVAMMVRRYMVPFAYDRMYNCYYNGSMDWLYGKNFDPTSILDACKVSVHRHAEFVGGLCIAFIVLGATMLLTWLTDHFTRQVWPVGSQEHRRRTRGFDWIRTWCGVGMILVGGWVVWQLWPLF
jgi:hypothetical protein